MQEQGQQTNVEVQGDQVVEPTGQESVMQHIQPLGARAQGSNLQAVESRDSNTIPQAVGSRAAEDQPTASGGQLTIEATSAMPVPDGTVNRNCAYWLVTQMVSESGLEDRASRRQVSSGGQSIP